MLWRQSIAQIVASVRAKYLGADDLNRPVKPYIPSAKDHRAS